IMVASDVAARGLDVENLELVINYEVPKGGEEYIHRIGRTGRAGKAGTAVIFATVEEAKLLKAIEKRIEQKIAEYPKKVAKKELPLPKIDMVEEEEPLAAPKEMLAPADKETSTEIVETKQTPIKVTRPPIKTLPAAPATTVVGFGDAIPAFMRHK
ncbi:MAG: C-terminal helicase domain-containing protein, partial [Alphaproteobacteria bacterium]